MAFATVRSILGDLFGAERVVLAGSPVRFVPLSPSGLVKLNSFLFFPRPLTHPPPPTAPRILRLNSPRLPGDLA